MATTTPPATPKPETPTLDQMQAPHVGGWTRKRGEECRLVDHSQLIGEFLDWLETEAGGGLLLAKWGEGTGDGTFGDDELFPHHEPREKLLARYFRIDLQKADDEKRALLEYVRAQHKENDERASRSEPDRDGAANREHPPAEAAG